MEPANYYATPELAARYDLEAGDRRDLPFYVALARQLRAAAVGDVGAGTGRLCSLLIGAGVRRVIGVEPQETMLALARRQPGADRVEWVHGTAADLPAGALDPVVMSGHVAQYFLDDDSWRQVLTEVAAALAPAGRVAFEIRNAAREEWRQWNDDRPQPWVDGTVQTRTTLTGDLATHVDTWVVDGRRWTTSETLRFPSWPAVERGLSAAGLAVQLRWGDWDGSSVRPDSPEWIVLAGRC